jgi:hypothetical protein
MAQLGQGLVPRVVSLVLYTAMPAVLICAVPAIASAEGRVYEMVSPPFKGGYDAGGLKAVAPDGESVVFASLGAFAGAGASSTINGYLSRRGTSGWATTSLSPPASIAPFSYLGEPTDYSASLASSLTFTVAGINHGEAEYFGNKDEFLLHKNNAPDVASAFEVGGAVVSAPNSKQLLVSYSGASSEFAHILFQARNGEGPLAPPGTGTHLELYDLPTDSSGPLRVVGVNNSGESIDEVCPVTLGSETGEAAKGSRFNAVSSDGTSIFFTTSRGNAKASKECEDSENPVVYVRIDGQKTVMVSSVPPGSCVAPAICSTAPRQSVTFEGANEEGNRVFFTTTQPLVTGDVDQERDLYMAVIGCPVGTSPCSQQEEGVQSLTEISHAPVSSEPAQVQGVVRISADGTRVYFVAHGVLTNEVNSEGKTAVKGADNLYTYDTHTEAAPAFIATLCSGPEASGGVKDTDCPSDLTTGDNGRNDADLWRSSVPEAQTFGEGRFLVFTSFGRLVGSDTDNSRDVYRFDASTGSLVRVSVGEKGFDANGNDEFDSTLNKGSGNTAVFQVHSMDSRAISENGAYIVFTTVSPLSPDAVNGVSNAYLWRAEEGVPEGAVSLVSSGSSADGVENVVMAPELSEATQGRDIFFATTQTLVPEDKDTAPDIYDDRMDGRAIEHPAERQSCVESGGCQGPLSVPGLLLEPGSVVETAGENFAPPAKKLAKKNKVKKTKVKKTKNKVRKNRKAKKSTKAHSRSVYASAHELGTRDGGTRR